MNIEIDRPSLSVLMPNYNHSKYIGDALTAILKQSYKPLEVIVIDDASTDNSVEIIQQFVNLNPSIRLLLNVKNIGVVHNLNRLLELAKGDYVYFAAADDKILPGFFERSMNLLSQHPQAGLCSTLSLIIDEEGSNKGLHPSLIISSKESFVSPEEASTILNKAGMWVMGNAAILKRKALLDSGGFIPELHSFCDGFIYQVIALKYGVCFIPEPLACWRRMESGYAMSVSRNTDVINEITGHAVRLMQTTYNSLFTMKYIDDFERVQFFLMNLNLFCSMNEKRLVPGNLIFFLNSLLFKLKKLICLLYLFIRFRPGIFPIVRRKINKLFYLKKFRAGRGISVG